MTSQAVTKSTTAPGLLAKSERPLTPLSLPEFQYEPARWSVSRTENVEQVAEAWQKSPNLVRIFQDPKFGSMQMALLRKDQLELLIQALRDWKQPDTAARWRKHLRALAQLPHLMCKLSGLVTETAWGQAGSVSASDHAAILQCCDEALEAFGPQRLMFGSDWPVCQLAAPYAQVADTALQWAASRLSASEQHAFWSGNAARAYGLTLPTSP